MFYFNKSRHIFLFTTLTALLILLFFQFINTYKKEKTKKNFFHFWIVIQLYYTFVETKLYGYCQSIFSGETKIHQIYQTIFCNKLNFRITKKPVRPVIFEIKTFCLAIKYCFFIKLIHFLSKIKCFLSKIDWFDLKIWETMLKTLNSHFWKCRLLNWEHV